MEPEGGGDKGSGIHPLEKSQSYLGFLSNTGPDPLNNHTPTKQAFCAGQRNTDDGPLKVIFVYPMLLVVFVSSLA